MERLIAVVDEFVRIEAVVLVEPPGLAHVIKKLPLSGTEDTLS